MISVVQNRKYLKFVFTFLKEISSLLFNDRQSKKTEERQLSSTGGVWEDLFDLSLTWAASKCSKMSSSGSRAVSRRSQHPLESSLTVDHQEEVFSYIKSEVSMHQNRLKKGYRLRFMLWVKQNTSKNWQEREGHIFLFGIQMVVMVSTLMYLLKGHAPLAVSEHFSTLLTNFHGIKCWFAVRNGQK